MFNPDGTPMTAQQALLMAQRLAAQEAASSAGGSSTPRGDKSQRTNGVAGISNLPPVATATAEPVNVVQGQAVVPPPPPGAQQGPPGLNPLAAAWAPVVNMLGQVNRTLEHVSRTGNTSRGFDGEVATVKDVSGIFYDVPGPLLERGEYVKSLTLKLETNLSGIRFKSDPFQAVGIETNSDPTIVANYKNHSFPSINRIIPFAVVFSAQGKDSTIKLPNTCNVECVIPIPTRIMNALSKHVYLFLVDKISKSMRMLHKTECNKYDGFTLIQRILTLERESLHTPLEVLNKRERDTTIDKLNDWNTFEPDFNDLMDAFNEAEKLKRIDSKDNKSLRAWKDLLIEKTHHLFDSAGAAGARCCFLGSKVLRQRPRLLRSHLGAVSVKHVDQGTFIPCRERS